MTPGGPPPSHIHPEAAAAAAATGGGVGEWRHGMAWRGMVWKPGWMYLLQHG